ncbi:MAG: hypothetical protein QXX41_08415 [Nitrososphaerota archaeon]
MRDVKLLLSTHLVKNEEGASSIGIGDALMSQVYEKLKKIIVPLLEVDNAIRVLRDLASRGILDSRVLQENLSKSMSVETDFIRKTISMLIEHGILRRKSVFEFEIVDKERVLEAIDALEKYLSDKVIAPDGYLMLFRRLVFFARSDNKIFRLRRLAIESIKREKVEYLIIPRSSLKDLVLVAALTCRENYGQRVCIPSFYWISPEELAYPKRLIKYFESSLKDGIAIARANEEELLNYTFDVEEDDLLEVDLSTLDKYTEQRIKPLLGKILRIKGDIDEHDEICSILADIGKVEGFEVSLEHKIVGDLRLDVAYLKDGTIAAAFEVVLEGNLKEALFKLSIVNAKAKFLVVERDKISKAQKIKPQDVIIVEAETLVEAQKSIAALANVFDVIKKALNPSVKMIE